MPSPHATLTSALGPATPPAAGTPATPPKGLAAEYDLEDSGFDPELDGPGVGAPTPPKSGTDAAPPAAPAAPKPKHPAYLTKRAQQLGIDQEAIDRLDSDALNELVYDRLHAQRDEARRDSRERTLHKDPVTGQFVSPPAAAPPGSPPTEPAKPGVKLADDPDLEAQLDPGFKKFLLGLHDRIEELTGAVRAVVGREQARENETRAEQIDRVFAGLGPEVEKHLGKGPLAKIKGTPEHKRRVEVLTGADALMKYGRSLEEAVGIIARGMFGGSAPASPPPPPAPHPGAPTPDQWDQAALPRPTNRTGRELPKGQKRAEQHVAARMAELNLNGDGGPDPDLPD